MNQIDKGMIFRVLLSVSLALAALGLFMISRTKSPKPPEQVQRDISTIATDIDREVDSILAGFSIEKQWIKKRQIPIPSTKLLRTERKVLIPIDVLPVQMNLAFNAMAHRYDGRAVASENLKEQTITIHLELERYVLQTIILKPTFNLQRGGRKSGQKKV
jgi:hypothetical protein